ncbi:MAG TPA: double zinc ribbon domain-containing protein, partial [Gemmatimonadales bacterium]
MPSALAQLLLPAECLLCHSLLPFAHSDALVCPVCRHRWRPVRPPWCERCGQPAPHFGPCRLCRDWTPALTGARSAVWLDAAARAAVHALKYGGYPR